MHISVTSTNATFDTRASGGWWAVCLCADWCGTCRDYRVIFDDLAQVHPDIRFEWVDIEDESALLADLDVETFPTLLVADGQRAHFLGPLLPQVPVLSRLLSSLQAGAGNQFAGTQAQEVFELVREARGRKRPPLADSRD